MEDGKMAGRRLFLGKKMREDEADEEEEVDSDGTLSTKMMMRMTMIFGRTLV